MVQKEAQLCPNLMASLFHPSFPFVKHSCYVAKGWKTKQKLRLQSTSSAFSTLRSQAWWHCVWQCRLPLLTLWAGAFPDLLCEARVAHKAQKSPLDLSTKKATKTGVLSHSWGSSPRTALLRAGVLSAHRVQTGEARCVLQSCLTLSWKELLLTVSWGKGRRRGGWGGSLVFISVPTACFHYVTFV